MLLIFNKQLCYTVCDYYMFIFNNQHLPAARRVSSVDIATRYGLEGQVIEFRTRPYRPWSPSSLLLNGYWVLPGNKAVKKECCYIDFKPR